MSTDIPNKTRRKSFLDVGGPNSLNNFASSYTRAQSYIGSTFLESPVHDAISPNTSPSLLNTDEIVEIPPIPQGYNHIKTFTFPEADEETRLLLEGRTSARGSVSSYHSGNSTAPQTLFNAVNTLMGVGMLSLPFGMKLAGWYCGTIIIIATSMSCCFTVIILGRIIKLHPHLKTYGDIAHAYGGPGFSYFVTCVFSVDLLGACLSLILLFADSFINLVPGISSAAFKTMVVSAVFILSFLPLSILSMISLCGIVCTFSIIVVIAICGLITHTTPGSLFVPEVTNLYPTNFNSLMLSLGLFMAPWGGHPIFPELYRDMRHPSKYSGCCKASFATTFAFDYTIAVLGFLMFGIFCEDSIIKNLMTNENYPTWVNPLICIFMGLLPLTKLPLVTKPIITVFENVMGIQTMSEKSFQKISARFAFFVFLLTVSLLFNSFGQVVSFLGSAICFTICLIFPLLFYLHFFKEVSFHTRILIKTGIVLCIFGALLGTYASLTMESTR